MIHDSDESIKRFGWLVVQKWSIVYSLCRLGLGTVPYGGIHGHLPVSTCFVLSQDGRQQEEDHPRACSS